MSTGLHPASGVPSLGFVQEQPTQFDEPFYRYLAAEAKVRFAVYYYGAGAGQIHSDPEIGRNVGWTPAADRGYAAVFAKGASALGFAGQVARAKHDLLIVSGYNKRHALCTAMRARLSGTAAGLRSDNVLPAAGGRRRFWIAKRLMYPLLFSFYKVGFPVGRQAGEYLERFGFRSESLFRFPYAVDHSWFAHESAAARADLAATRRFWGLPESGPVVCGVMKFSEREDPLTLIRAFHAALAQIPGLSLLLVGDGPLRAQVESEAGELLGTRVLLPGYQRYEMLPRAYAASDVFVHTAAGAWEVSVNEALACGLPAITSDEVGSADEIVLPGGFGATFPRGDAAALAERMVSVLRDEHRMRHARENGFASLKEWDYPATARRLRDAVRFACPGRFPALNEAHAG